jgi:hypothetical protein
MGKLLAGLCGCLPLVTPLAHIGIPEDTLNQLDAILLPADNDSEPTDSTS